MLTSIYLAIELSLRETDLFCFVRARSFARAKSCAVGMRNAKLGNHLNNVIESTNKFSNPRFVTTSRKIFCKSEKIFCHVLLAPAVNQRQSLFPPFCPIQNGGEAGVG